MNKLRVLDLFSGIGGFSLGLERTGGFETVAFCEIEKFPRQVLAKHWPDVPCYDDVRTLTAERLTADGIAVDVICGGFPCQDISYAGLGAGLAGERSGLFYEVARLVGELGPRYVILENVGALLYRGVDAVLGTLASIGYDAEWHCIPASAIGAPHRRDRIWIIAYPGGEQHQSKGDAEWWTASEGLPQATLADAKSERCREEGELRKQPPQWLASGGEVLADAMCINGKGKQPRSVDKEEWAGSILRSTGSRSDGERWWAVEPNVGRVAHGVPDRAHRLKALGNAVVPQIPELIGNAILRSMTPAIKEAV